MSERIERRSTVSGFAKHLPEWCVTNEYLSTRMDTSDEWIRTRTGIETRYWARAPQTTSALGLAAAQQSLSFAHQGTVDAVIAATLSPDFTFPGIGVQIAAGLKLGTVPAYDIRNQCSGFLYALEMADAFVRSGVYRRVLIVGAEIQSTGLDVTTRGRDMAVLFGDGAASCIVQEATLPTRGNAFEVLTTAVRSDGEHARELWCENPGSASHPARVMVEMIESGSIYPQMHGRRVFENAVRRMSEIALEVLAAVGLTIKDVSLFVPHQANLRINQAVAKELGLTESQVFSTIQRYGNTTSATIPIGMTDAVAERGFRSGEVVLQAAFGSGFTWGATVLRTR